MLSFWQQDAFLQPADVVIAGGGFMGLWAAYELKKQHPSLRITVLEKDSFPGGASVRNAGFACFGSPGELLADAATVGEEAMWQVVEMRYRGIGKIRRILGDEAIDYDACGGYECFTGKPIFEYVADRLSWLNKRMENITGTADVFTIADDNIAKLGMRNFSHTIANRLEGGLHSGKTIRALLKKLAALDVTVLNGIQVKSWNHSGSNIEIHIGGKPDGMITAKKLLIATNAFATQLSNSIPVLPARGQVLITKPIEGLKLTGTFHYDEGFYYWRNVGNRILLGGARNQALSDEHTHTTETSVTIQNALIDFLHRHINLPPHQLQIDYSWAGIMGFTQNKQPIIQTIASNVWAAIACNGMGVSLTPVMAEEVATQMMG